jgi:trk system potassium uptake protein TrkA
MKIIIIGCGRLGSELAYRLFRRGHEVTIVDNKASAFQHLSLDFAGRLNEGDALDQDVLERAGVASADALAAVTSSDAINIVVGHVARQVYKIPKVVARNFDPSCCTIFDAFGVHMIASSSWGAQRLEEMLYHSDVRTVFSAGNGEVEVYELPIPPSWQGRPLKDLANIEGCLLISLTRAGRAMLPDLTVHLEGGDIVHASATFEGIENLRNILTNKSEE